MSDPDARTSVVARSMTVVAGLLLLATVVAALPQLSVLRSADRAIAAVVMQIPQRSLAEPVSTERISGLMAPALDLPQRFLPTDVPAAADVCEALADAGFANGGWTRSGVAQGRWECFADTAEEVAAAPYSVFYMLRGAADRVDEMRLKVSLRDTAAAVPLRRRVADFLDTLAVSAHLNFPPTFLASVRSGGWATYVSPKATYVFAREDGAVPKWNLSIALADPADIQRTGKALSLPVKAVRGVRPRLPVVAAAAAVER